MLTRAVFPTKSIDVYDSRKIFFEDFNISNPLTVMSFVSPRSKPIKYNILYAGHMISHVWYKDCHTGEFLHPSNIRYLIEIYYSSVYIWMPPESVQEESAVYYH